MNRHAFCGSGRVDAIETTSGAATSSMSFADGGYTYTWKTSKGAVGCRDLVLRFRDGTEPSARFQLR